MSMIETIMKLDRKVRRLYEEFGLEYDDDVVMRVPDPPINQGVRVSPNRVVNGQKRWTPEDKSQLIQLVKQGVSSQEIARVMKRSGSAIHSQVCNFRKEGRIPPLNEERT